MVRNELDHPIDLSPDGRTLAPGATGEADLKDPHNQALLQDGSLSEVSGTQKQKKEKTESGEDN